MAQTRYAALLRGVSPMNAKMPALKAAFEAGGMRNVRTLLASGNVVFDARASTTRALEHKVERAMQDHLGRAFMTIVRSLDTLDEIIERDPFARVRLPKDAKRIVTFLRDPPTKEVALPVELDGAKIVSLAGSEVFTFYVPSPKGATFMTLIEKTFGKDVTTRTWDTVKKVAAAKA